MLESLTKDFSNEIDKLSFSSPFYVYNPLSYAWANHEAYLSTYVNKGASVLYLGMNPGPFGMVQTGIPFGAIDPVLNYLKLTKPINKPKVEHPNRPIEGLLTKRNEVSGSRLWSLFESEFPNPKDFFKTQTVFNYCPLAFLDSSKTAKNITPDKLLKNERQELERLCDEYLRQSIDQVGWTTLIGVGLYAKKKLEALKLPNVKVYSIIHPSPASPLANKGWAERTKADLQSFGVWKQ